MLVVAVDLALDLLFVVVYFGNFAHRSLIFLDLLFIFFRLLRDIRGQDANFTGHIMDILNDLRFVDGSRVAGSVTLWPIIIIGVSILDELLLVLTLLRWSPHNAATLLCSSARLDYFLRVNLCTRFAVSYWVKIRWWLCAWSHVSCWARLGLTRVDLLAWTQSIGACALIGFVFLIILSTVTCGSFGRRCGSFWRFIILAVIIFFTCASMGTLDSRWLRILSLSSMSILNSTVNSS